MGKYNRLGLAMGGYLSLAMASNALAEVEVKLPDFMPENNLHVHEMAGESNVTKEQFYAIIEKAQNLYGPVIKDYHSGNLKIRALWENPTVNASASQRGPNWYITMYGGLARHPIVTPDAFALVVCHEMGHHIGGYPYINYWAANEGQADYYATQACAHHIWEDEVEENASFASQISEFGKALCDNHWAEDNQRNLCYRSLLAGKALGTLLATLRGSGEVDFDTPDSSVVSRTKHPHPKAQCRLDTYVAGALCTVPQPIEIIPGSQGINRNSLESELAAAPYQCTRKGGLADIQSRPRCWFKPLSETETSSFTDQALSFGADPYRTLY